jgi:serine/threonine protein kinase
VQCYSRNQSLARTGSSQCGTYDAVKYAIETLEFQKAMHIHFTDSFVCIHLSLLLISLQVKLLDIIQAQPGGLYLVFEFVAHDLKTFMSDDISERVGLPVPTVRSFLRQIIAGVRVLCDKCMTFTLVLLSLSMKEIRDLFLHTRIVLTLYLTLCISSVAYL